MKRSKLFDYIRQVLKNEFGVKQELISYESSFGSDFMFSDFDLNLLLYFIESRYNVKLGESINLKSNLKELTDEAVSNKSINI